MADLKVQLRKKNTKKNKLSKEIDATHLKIIKEVRNLVSAELRRVDVNINGLMNLRKLDSKFATKFNDKAYGPLVGLEAEYIKISQSLFEMKRVESSGKLMKSDLQSEKKLRKALKELLDSKKLKKSKKEQEELIKKIEEKIGKEKKSLLDDISNLKGTVLKDLKSIEFTSLGGGIFLSSIEKKADLLFKEILKLYDLKHKVLQPEIDFLKYQIGLSELKGSNLISASQVENFKELIGTLKTKAVEIEKAEKKYEKDAQWDKADAFMKEMFLGKTTLTTKEKLTRLYALILDKIPFDQLLNLALQCLWKKIGMDKKALCKMIVSNLEPVGVFNEILLPFCKLVLGKRGEGPYNVMLEKALEKAGPDISGMVSPEQTELFVKKADKFGQLVNKTGEVWNSAHPTSGAYANEIKEAANELVEIISSILDLEKLCNTLFDAIEQFAKSFLKNALFFSFSNVKEAGWAALQKVGGDFYKMADFFRSLKDRFPPAIGFPINYPFVDGNDEWKKNIENVILDSIISEFMALAFQIIMEAMNDACSDELPGEISADDIFPTLNIDLGDLLNYRCQKIIPEIIRFVFSLLTPAEICLLLKGEPSPLTISLIMNFVAKKFPECKEYFDEEHEIINLFLKLASHADMTVCDNVDERAKPAEFCEDKTINRLIELRHCLCKGQNISFEDCQKAIDDNYKNKNKRFENILNLLFNDNAFDLLITRELACPPLSPTTKASIKTANESIFKTSMHAYEENLDLFKDSLVYDSQLAEYSANISNPKNKIHRNHWIPREVYPKPLNLPKDVPVPDNLPKIKGPIINPEYIAAFRSGAMVHPVGNMTLEDWQKAKFDDAWKRLYAVSGGAPTAKTGKSSAHKKILSELPAEWKRPDHGDNGEWIQKNFTFVDKPMSKNINVIPPALWEYKEDRDFLPEFQSYLSTLGSRSSTQFLEFNDLSNHRTDKSFELIMKDGKGLYNIRYSIDKKFSMSRMDEALTYKKDFELVIGSKLADQIPDASSEIHKALKALENTTFAEDKVKKKILSNDKSSKVSKFINDVNTFKRDKFSPQQQVFYSVLAGAFNRMGNKVSPPGSSQKLINFTAKQREHISFEVYKDVFESFIKTISQNLHASEIFKKITVKGYSDVELLKFHTLNFNPGLEGSGECDPSIFNFKQLGERIINDFENRRCDKDQDFSKLVLNNGKTFLQEVMKDYFIVAIIRTYVLEFLLKGVAVIYEASKHLEFVELEAIENIVGDTCYDFVMKSMRMENQLANLFPIDFDNLLIFFKKQAAVILKGFTPSIIPKETENPLKMLVNYECSYLIQRIATVLQAESKDPELIKTYDVIDHSYVEKRGNKFKPSTSTPPARFSNQAGNSFFITEKYIKVKAKEEIKGDLNKWDTSIEGLQTRMKPKNLEASWNDQISHSKSREKILDFYAKIIAEKMAPKWKKLYDDMGDIIKKGPLKDKESIIWSILKSLLWPPNFVFKFGLSQVQKASQILTFIYYYKIPPAPCVSAAGRAGICDSHMAKDLKCWAEIKTRVRSLDSTDSFVDFFEDLATRLSGLSDSWLKAETKKCLKGIRRNAWLQWTWNKKTPNKLVATQILIDRIKDKIKIEHYKDNWIEKERFRLEKLLHKAIGANMLNTLQGIKTAKDFFSEGKNVIFEKGKEEILSLNRFEEKLKHSALVDTAIFETAFEYIKIGTRFCLIERGVQKSLILPDGSFPANVKEIVNNFSNLDFDNLGLKEDIFKTSYYEKSILEYSAEITPRSAIGSWNFILPLSNKENDIELEDFIKESKELTSWSAIRSRFKSEIPDLQKELMKTDAVEAMVGYSIPTNDIVSLFLLSNVAHVNFTRGQSSLFFDLKEEFFSTLKSLVSSDDFDFFGAEKERFENALEDSVLNERDWSAIILKIVIETPWSILKSLLEGYDPNIGTTKKFLDLIRSGFDLSVMAASLADIGIMAVDPEAEPIAPWLKERLDNCVPLYAAAFSIPFWVMGLWPSSPILAIAYLTENTIRETKSLVEAVNKGICSDSKLEISGESLFKDKIPCPIDKFEWGSLE